MRHLIALKANWLIGMNQYINFAYGTVRKIERVAMHLFRQISFSLVLAIFVTGCLSTDYDTDYSDETNYTLGLVQEASVGSTMVLKEYMEQVGRPGFGGSLLSGYGANEGGPRYTDDSFKEELIYTGRSEDTITISYREYRRDFARPAFFQELKYDLSKSKSVAFKSYKIEVVEASNEKIVFKVLSD